MPKSPPKSSNRRTAIIIVLIAVASFGLLFAGASWYGGKSTGEEIVFNGISVPPLPTLSIAKVTPGEQLYQQYCASCHGVNLEGAPDWKQPLEDGSLPPPPQDSSGHTWHHEDPLLVSIITEGSVELYGGNMPGFDDRMSQEEIGAVLEFIKSRWGVEEREYQWWITARAENIETTP